MFKAMRRMQRTKYGGLLLRDIKGSDGGIGQFPQYFRRINQATLETLRQDSESHGDNTTRFSHDAKRSRSKKNRDQNPLLFRAATGVKYWGGTKTTYIKNCSNPLI